MLRRALSMLATVGFALLACVVLPRCTALVSTSGLAGGLDAGLDDGSPVVVGGDASCEGAPCSPSSCSADRASCDGDPANGCETDLRASAQNCGACGNGCAPETGALCKQGKCAVPRSCAELFALSPRPTSGVYRLDISGSGSVSAFDAYCELDPNANGGGWTLLIKVDGASKRFVYGDPLWLNAATYNGDQPNVDTVEAKLAGFASMPVAAVRLGMVDAGTTRWVVVPVTAPSLMALFNRGSTPTSLGRDAWRGLVASPSTQDNCNREGFNVLDDRAVDSIRFGMLFNNEVDCTSPDSFIGIGTTFGVTAGNFADMTSPDRGPRDTKVLAYVMIR